MGMSENQKNYIPLIIPLKKSIQELNKRESQEYFEWFLSHIDERADYLKQKVSNGLHISIDSLDFSLESLKPIWEWFLSVAEVSKTSKEDLKILERSLSGHPQSFIDSILEQSKERLNVFTEYVLRDIGMYVSKVFLSNYPVLKWTVKRTPKTYVHVNEPVIIGFIDDNEEYPEPFYPDLEPIDLARIPAMKVLRRQQPHKDDLFEECMKWVVWIPKKEMDVD